MKGPAAWVLGCVALAAFLFMVKLMQDISTDMGRMSGHVETMTTQVQRLSDDVHGMRQSMDRMTVVVQQGGQQIQQMNPMEMMRGMTPAQPQR